MTSPRFGRPPSPRGLFVTGTDTGVGKTVVASAIAATLAARGERVAVFKPVVTGLAEASGSAPDHELLRASARSTQTTDQIAPYRFQPPVSPHLAAALAGETVDPGLLVQRALAAAASADVIVVEGVGGLAVPLARGYLVRDFAAALGLPVLVVARPGLGTISHTLLTVESARVAGLEVLSVVLANWPEQPGEMERSNLETIASLAAVEVTTLGPIYTGPPINAVTDLPVERWLRVPSAVAEPLTV